MPPGSGLFLPSSTSTLCLDRFSLTDADTDEPVPFWPIFCKILTPASQSTSQFIEALDTITVSLRRNSDSYEFLRRFLDTEWDTESFFQMTWPRCVAIALEMPVLFPDGHLYLLTSERPTQKFTPRQITCLVIHQFLCTLPKLPWVPIGQEENSQELHIWYASEQPHPNAVRAYLTALFTFFDRATFDTLPHNPHSPRRPLDAVPTPRVNMSLLGLPSASQEEMHVGCTPQALPATLITPPLKHNEVMVLRGCEALVELTGYVCTAELAVVVPAGTHDCSRWMMLFMDALELDSHDASASTPDLLPGNVDRELMKAYTAFASSADGIPYDTAVTGHWGCGAFGGNQEVKSIIQWCAASLAGVKLNFVCDKVCFPS
ncbi:hypothetical protein DFH07DRAFT_867403 [Mycena maculata]|uniref:poly(ADP-ribose) glycohydrolase n=1 Tax=Mycena maculata TaxID=230809 RepID=A0AAD7NIA1_9AGAR|nr:hypothetical protein DFH07DRAFT_867403 [Mycena maculata]